MFCLGFKTTDRVVFLALAVTIGFGLPPLAAAQDTANEIPESARKTIADLTARVADLERVVGGLRSGPDEPWLTTRRAAEIRGLVQDVLADADTRSSLLQDGMTAGWDKGFFLGSADGNFLLKVQGQLQVRLVYNTQDNSADDDHRWGFENRRTKLTFSGNVIDPSWQYRIQTSAGRDGGRFRLQSALIAKEFGDNWTDPMVNACDRIARCRLTVAGLLGVPRTVISFANFSLCSAINAGVTSASKWLPIRSFHTSSWRF